MSTILEGRYQLGREIGAGGFACVYEARDLEIERTVAVKVVRPAYARQADVLARLDREGRIGAMLAHPNVCAVTDLGRCADGTPFIVLERLVGETLAERLARGRLPRELALEIGRQLLSGLSAAHAAGVVHRDVKPGNLFLVDVGDGVVVKLIDFGLAKVPGAPVFELEARTQTGVVLGTAPYMSPEQVRGTRDYDARTDVYSAAVVIYELLTGAPPFAHLPPHEMFEAIAHRKPPSLATHVPDAPPHVVRAVDAALHVSREHRPANAAAFLERQREGATSRPADDWELATWQGTSEEVGASSPGTISVPPARRSPR